MGYVIKLIPNDCRKEVEQSLTESLLDCVEKFVTRTDNTIDDILVLPMIKALRLAFDKTEDKEEN
jgi:hypothetical protein